MRHSVQVMLVPPALPSSSNYVKTCCLAHPAHDFEHLPAQTREPPLVKQDSNVLLIAPCRAHSKTGMGRGPEACSSLRPDLPSWAQPNG